MLKKTSLNQSNDTKFNGQLVVYDKQNGAENGASETNIFARIYPRKWGGLHLGECQVFFFVLLMGIVTPTEIDKITCPYSSGILPIQGFFWVAILRVVYIKYTCMYRY